MRLFGALLLLLSIASPGKAQSEHESVDVWASVTLGGGNVGHAQSSSVAARLAAWGAVGHRIFGARLATAGPWFADNHTDVEDVALLGGIRGTEQTPGSIAAGAGSLALGPALLTRTVRLGGRVDSKTGPVPALAFDADGTLHLRVIGIGLSVFGAIGVHNMYSAAGVTLSLGKIH